MLSEETEPEGRAASGDFLRAAMRYKTRADINLDTHISLKHRYVYLMVGKAASSTVTYHLQCVEYRGTRYQPGNVNSRHQSPHLAPFQLARRDFVTVMTGRKLPPVHLRAQPLFAAPVVLPAPHHRSGAVEPEQEGRCAKHGPGRRPRDA